MGILFAIVFAASDHGIYVVPFAIVVALLAEWIMSRGHYQSVKLARWAYTAFSLLTFSLLFPLFVTRKQHLQQLVDTGYGQDYADKLAQVLPVWSFPIVVD